ncbi:MAG: hypothetical protein PHX78_05920 [bacterium]|nr:hypothetical protein [bacterium]
MKNKIILIYLLPILFLGCSSDSVVSRKRQYNEEPLFGNIEKTDYQKQADTRFIQEVITESGNKEAATGNTLKSAWNYYYKGDYSLAMKRFNQAWLLDNNNAEVFWGFGLIMGIRAWSENPGKNLSESIKFLEKANELFKDNPNLLIDLAHSEIMLGNFLKDNKREEFQNHFDKARSLFQKSEGLNKNIPLLYLNWSLLEFFEKKYAEAKVKLDIAKKMGFKPDLNYEKDLEKHLKK